MIEHELTRASSSRAIGTVRDRIALLASYGSDSRVTPSLAAYVSELDRLGYQPIVIRASEDPSPLRWPTPPPESTVVLRRQNVGYDFGSWSAAIAAVPSIVDAENVLITNDSLVGPFAPLDPLVEHFESRTADAWGAVTNPQFFPHLQSFLLGFRGATLRHHALRRFWAGIRPQAQKMDYVMKYELGLTRLLISEGFVLESRFPDRSLGIGHVNPTLLRASELMRRGFPFVKRALVVSDDPELAASAARSVRTARDLFGVEVGEWL